MGDFIPSNLGDKSLHFQLIYAYQKVLETINVLWKLNSKNHDLGNNRISNVKLNLLKTSEILNNQMFRLTIF